MADLYNMQELGGTTFLSVSNITPTQEPAGQAFTLTYTVTNHTTMNLNAYGQVTDDTNPTMPLGAWTQAIPRNGGAYQASLNFPNGITTTFNGHIEVGHIGELICDWIFDHGGANGLDITKVFQIVDSYVLNQPPSGGYAFIPTIQQVFGVIDYYLGFIPSGNTGTGCDYA